MQQRWDRNRRWRKNLRPNMKPLTWQPLRSMPSPPGWEMRLKDLPHMRNR
jgi:hypothetical protein